MNVNACSHWACNKADNTCVGCGAIICPNMPKRTSKL